MEAVQVFYEGQAVETDNFGRGVVVVPDGGDRTPNHVTILFDNPNGMVNPRRVLAKAVRAVR